MPGTIVIHWLSVLNLKLSGWGLGLKGLWFKGQVFCVVLGFGAKGFRV